MEAHGPQGTLRMVSTLAVAGLLSGLVLVAVQLETEPRILRNRAEALNQAIYRVLPGTVEIRRWAVRGGALARVDGPSGDGEIYAGHRTDGTLIGYAIPASGPGFMDTIGLIYGYDPGAHRIVGIQVLDSRETPGLGDKIITDETFLRNFDALEIEPSIVPVKHGSKSRSNEVDCITGATISSEAIVAILNASAENWAALLEAGHAPTEVSRNAGR
ncbi:MAG TPA: FMN-binding protein [Candidatus Polarisedimenticolaceae bacterium]|nr:FMN-binding protein [Candidatus Polarisedimenticolaceae bacterium]